MPVSPELMRRLSRACEENAARQTLRSYALAARYPSGRVPPWGVTMCREWLREGLDEGSLDFQLLNQIEVHNDDQGWSLNGMPQGGVWNLVEFILGPLQGEAADSVETDMYVDYQGLVSEVRFAVERDRQLKEPWRAPGQQLSTLEPTRAPSSAPNSPKSQRVNRRY